MNTEQVVIEWAKENGWEESDEDNFITFPSIKLDDLISKLSGFVSREDVITEMKEVFELLEIHTVIDGYMRCNNHFCDTDGLTFKEFVNKLKLKFMPEPSKGEKTSVGMKNTPNTEGYILPLETSGTKDDLEIVRSMKPSRIRQMKKLDTEENNIITTFNHATLGIITFGDTIIDDCGISGIFIGIEEDKENPDNPFIVQLKGDKKELDTGDWASEIIKTIKKDSIPISKVEEIIDKTYLEKVLPSYWVDKKKLEILRKIFEELKSAIRKEAVKIA